MIGDRVPAYLCSLPERLLRSASALAGGAVHELGDVVLPLRVRRSKIYDTLVESTARFLIETVGQMEDAYPKSEHVPDDYMGRWLAGNVVSIAGLAAFRASPVWVLAALSDLAGAGRELIPEIAEALERDGLLERGRKFESLEQLLDGLEQSSGRLAEAMNTPPLNAADLREEWTRLRQNAAQVPRALIPSAASVRAQWADLQQEAAAQNRSVLELSSLIAISAVRKLPANVRWLSNAARTASRRTGQVLAEGLLDHYRSALAEIRATGYIGYWIREFRPYLVAAVRQFAPTRVSTTERLLRRKSSETPLGAQRTKD